MARGDVVVIDLPVSELREQSGRRPAVAVQTDLAGDLRSQCKPIWPASQCSWWLQLHRTWLRYDSPSPYLLSRRLKTD